MLVWSFRESGAKLDSKSAKRPTNRLLGSWVCSICACAKTLHLVRAYDYCPSLSYTAVLFSASDPCSCCRNPLSVKA